MIAVAATGSVGETIAPSAKAIGQESPITSWPITATTPIVASTRPIASSEIGRRLLRSARRSEKKAAEYSSGGRKTSRTRSGSSSISGIPGSDTEHQAAEHERDRVGDREPAREHVQSGDRDEQDGEEDLEVLHGGILAQGVNSNSCRVSEQVVIARRFNGPPDSAHGGYACAVAAQFLDWSAEVTLRRPPPLEQPLAVQRGGDGSVSLLEGDALVMQASPANLDLDVPDPVSLAEAEAAAENFAWLGRHPVPNLFWVRAGQSGGRRHA